MATEVVRPRRRFLRPGDRIGTRPGPANHVLMTGTVRYVDIRGTVHVRWGNGPDGQVTWDEEIQIL